MNGFYLLTFSNNSAYQMKKQTGKSRRQKEDTQTNLSQRRCAVKLLQNSHVLKVNTPQSSKENIIQKPSTLSRRKNLSQEDKRSTPPPPPQKKKHLTPQLSHDLNSKTVILQLHFKCLVYTWIWFYKAFYAIIEIPSEITAGIMPLA